MQHHTAKNIGQRLLSNCEEAGITSKVVAITCDEAANQCAAIREDRAEVAKKYSEVDADSYWKSVVCTAHRLQNCIKHALQVEDVAALL